MAEIQRSTHAGELTQQFIEFIMMQAQQAALCLGQIPHPSTGKAELNLDAARMFIDHLEIIREKTKGNLSKEEEKILNGILSELQLSFVQVSSHAAPEGHDHLDSTPQEATSEAMDSGVEAAPSLDPTSVPEQSTPPAQEEEEHKKKFTKSYGS